MTSSSSSSSSSSSVPVHNSPGLQARVRVLPYGGRPVQHTAGHVRGVQPAGGLRRRRQHLRVVQEVLRAPRARQGGALVLRTRNKLSSLDRSSFGEPSTHVSMSVHPAGTSRGHVRSRFGCLFAVTLLPGNGGGGGGRSQKKGKGPAAAAGDGAAGEKGTFHLERSRLWELQVRSSKKHSPRHSSPLAGITN